jgi:hypothetical protein
MKTVNDLRDVLFEQLERLRGKEVDPKELDRARAIADVSKVIVESAKVEVDFVKATGADGGSGFIPQATETEQAPRKVATVSRRSLPAAPAVDDDAPLVPARRH